MDESWQDERTRKKLGTGFGYDHFPGLWPPMILGCILILLGAPFAIANWYSPFSEDMSGKHSSMVPPVGGVLIGVGVYWLTGSWWWALVGIPADFGLLFLVLAFPWIIREFYSRSRFTLVHELHGWKDGHRTILKLYKNSGAELTYGHGPTQYGINGTWLDTDLGYQVSLKDDFVFDLEKDGRTWVVTSIESSSEEDWHPDLNDLVFEPLCQGGKVKAEKRTSTQ